MSGISIKHPDEDPIKDIQNRYFICYVCPLFICQRIMLFTQLTDVADFLNIDVLLKGSPDLSFDDNVLIMNSVHTFICGTKRLDYKHFSI